MISAIIYSSTTGSCKQYAEKLSAALHIPAFDAKKVYTPKGREVIYVGWLFAGKVVGLEKALQGYDVRAVVQVGMAEKTYRALLARRTHAARRTASPQTCRFSPCRGAFISPVCRCRSSSS